MSNPTDPTRPNPDQPDPKKKPEDANQPGGSEQRTPTSRSSFEFELPPEVGSYSDMPPIPQPDANETGSFNPALPPRPTASQKPSNVSFDFIDLDAPPGAGPKSGSGSGLKGVTATPTPIEPLGTSEPPLLTPTTNVNLPGVPAPPATVVDDDLFDFGAPLPSAGGGSTSSTLGAALPAVPEAQPASGTKSVPDISTLFPPAAPVPEVPAALPLPEAQPLSGVSIGSTADLPVAQPTSDVFGSSEVDLPVAQPLSDQNLAPIPPVTTPTPDLDSVLGAPLAGRAASPTLDLDAEVSDLTPVMRIEPVAPASGWLSSGNSDPGETPVVEPPAEEAMPVAELAPDEPEPAEAAPVEAAPAEPEKTPTGRSSFEFTLTQGDMDPVKLPDVEETGVFNTALPPRPEGTRRPTNVSFDFIDLPPDEAAKSGVKSGTGLQNIPATPTAIDTTEPPLLTPTGSVILPPEAFGPAPPKTPAQDPDEANLGALDSVKPASGWLDSGILSGGGPGSSLISSDPLDMPPAQPIESSDIFSGSRVKDALPVEQSDVIAATAYGNAPPAAADAGKPPEATRPSEVALTFDAPPGGSTMQDSGASDLPMADEVSGGSAILDEPRTDSESIHDMPGMTVPDPLFDSSKLADAPDPPRAKRDDSPEYGKAAPLTPDASSILADLSDPELFGHEGDSSSVRVESPGVNRTLTGGPAEGGFDLTVPDEPIPVDLFDEPGEGPPTDATDWQSQSGSDLFADRRTPPDVDLDSTGRVEPVDADLSPDQPSLSSAPSSIFSDSKLRGSSSDSAGSASGRVRIGNPPPPASDATDAIDAEAAEFSDHPELAETVERQPIEPGKPRRPHGLSSADFTLPPESTTPTKAVPDDGGAIDWDDASLASDENATRGIPRDASLSSIIRGMADDSAVHPTKEKEVPGGTEESSTPMVTVDWMAGSVEGKALGEETTDPELEDRIKKRREMEEQAKPKPAKGKAKPADTASPSAETRLKPLRGAAAPAASAEAEVAEPSEKAKPKAKEKPEKPAKKGGGMFVGLLLGALLAGGACAGVYFGGVVPNGDPSAKTNPDGDKGKQPPPVVQPGTDVKSAFASGDVGKALELVNAKTPETTDEKATAGSVLVYSAINGKGTATDRQKGQGYLKSVFEDPNAAKPENVDQAVKAAVLLGASLASEGKIEEAKKVFTDAKAKFTDPKHQAIFDAHLDRLNDAPADPGTSFRLTPAEVERMLLDTAILLQDGAPKADDPEESGVYYWKAQKLAREGKYKEAIDQIKLAKDAHVKRAKALAGRGLNPLTDPLEQMFPRSCDELIAYWTVKAELYRNPDIADAVKKNELGKKLDSLAKAEKDLATKTTDLKAANDKVTKLEKDVDKLDKDVKATEKAKLEADDKLKTALDDVKTAKGDLKTATDDLKTTKDKLTAAEKDATDKDNLLKSVVAELKPVVTIPEKWAPADLVGGVKNLVSFAKEKDVKTLLERVTKAEAAAKTATDKLKTETDKITTKYEADIKKLKDDNTADLKKMTDKYDADIKKLTDDYKAEAKKMTDKFDADTKKLKDDQAAAIKAEQAKTETEKKNAAAAAVSFQKQLANAVTPVQALDIWLPVLTDLRRPADADPSAAIAKRVLDSAVPDSDDEAKAHATIGMGLLLKGNYAAARDEFQIARRSPAYKADKPWAKVVDAGLEAVTDPLSPYRQPVVIPPVDLRAAAKSLDAGIAAYKAGKFEAAAKALADAAKNDPTDPVAWYFLGAARWALGDEKQALKDFAQGGEREKLSPTPAREVSAALTPLQGAVRDAIDKARP